MNGKEADITHVSANGNLLTFVGADGSMHSLDMAQIVSEHYRDLYPDTGTWLYKHEHLMPGYRDKTWFSCQVTTYR